MYYVLEQNRFFQFTWKTLTQYAWGLSLNGEVKGNWKFTCIIYRCILKNTTKEFNFLVKYIALTGTCGIIGVSVFDVYFCNWQIWLMKFLDLLVYPNFDEFDQNMPGTLLYF